MTANLPRDTLSAIERLVEKVRDIQGRLIATTPRKGTAPLTAGAATVSLASVTANSQIMLTVQAPGGTVGSPFVFSRIAGTSFTIHSTSGTDTSTVAYQVTEPG